MSKIFDSKNFNYALFHKSKFVVYQRFTLSGCKNIWIRKLFGFDLTPGILYLQNVEFTKLKGN